MINHLERLALSQQVMTPKPRVKPHHVVLAGVCMPIVYVAERFIHFAEVPAEIIWLVKIIIFKEL